MMKPITKNEVEKVKVKKAIEDKDVLKDQSELKLKLRLKTIIWIRRWLYDLELTWVK